MRDLAMKIGLSVLTACAGGTAWIVAEPGARSMITRFVGGDAAAPAQAAAAPLDLTPNPDAKPSFDCALASAKIEKLICSDPDIAEADRSLDRVWAGLKARDRITEELKLAQRQWIARRDACLIADDPRACVRKAMLERISELGAL